MRKALSDARFRSLARVARALGIDLRIILVGERQRVLKRVGHGSLAWRRRAAPVVGDDSPPAQPREPTMEARDCLILIPLIRPTPTRLTLPGPPPPTHRGRQPNSNKVPPP